MYNENSNFSIKNVIVQFLFVALFIFILIWLFPLKSDLNKLKTTSNSDNTDLSVLVDRIFNENIIAMKDAAKSYYTLERLPQNVGDKVKMTLGEMLDKKIILPFKDKHGNTCDLEASYVEVTKYDTEYLMKVNLKCGDEENYLLVYMGCYDYCSTTVCEKNTADVKAPVVYSAKKTATAATKSTGSTGTTITNNNTNNNTVVVNPTPSQNPTCAYKDNQYYDKNGKVTTKAEYEKQCVTQPTPSTKIVCAYVNGKYYDKNGNETTKTTYENQCIAKTRWYKYQLVTASSCTESNWSDWSTNKVTANANTAVQTKVVTTKKLIGYNVTTALDKTKPIYGTKEVETGAYETKQVCASYGYVATGEYTYGDWKYAETVYLNSTPSNSETVQYIKIDENSWVCGSNCTAGTTKAYKKYTRTKTPITKYQCTKYETKKTPITTTVQTITGYETKVVSKEPVYKEINTTYYRYKTRTCTAGTTKYAWSTSKTDNNLIKQGYTYINVWEDR